MSWFRHGFLNTLEHGLTRVADGLSTLILLWVLPPEAFSKLALAQAFVAPSLLFFLSPETVIYRDFAAWKKQGGHALAIRIRAFRFFAWGKGLLALLLAALGAAWGPGEGDFWLRFYAVIWAYALVLAPQICGADREYLRVDLKLEELNFLSLIQKGSLLGGTALAAFLFDGRVELIALAAVSSVVLTAVLARWRAEAHLIRRGASQTPVSWGEKWEFVWISVHSFSFWQHLSGVVLNWVQSMHLFFLGLYQFPAREVGLFAAVVKLANLSNALPMALANLYSIWVGRRSGTATTVKEEERKLLFRKTLFLFFTSSVQAIVLWLLSPYLFEWLSRGRWSAGEQVLMREWLAWVLVGAVLFGSSFLYSSWLTIRSEIRGLFVWVWMLWGVATVGILGGGIYWTLQLDGVPAGLLWAAQGTVVSAWVNAVLLWGYFRRNCPRSL